MRDQKEDTTRQLRKQGRQVSRNLFDRKEDMAHQLRKQGRHVSRNLADNRDDLSRRLRSQSQPLIDRGSQFLESQRENKIWPFLGFLAGFLLAGSLTAWLVQRALERRVVHEEHLSDESPRANLNGSFTGNTGDVHYTGQGGTAVATRPETKKQTRPARIEETSYRQEAAHSPVPQAGSVTRFVGVLSTHRYYPIEKKPADAQDLVFFSTEAEAKAEGYTPAL
jgi:hypothetical protein